MLQLSEEKLQDTERVQQSEITRSLASETLQFEQSLREQLQSQRQVLALTGWIENVDDPTHAPQLSRLLQDFVENNPNILYVTAVNKEAKGQSAGSFRADQDPFVEAALKRAFTASIQGFDSISEPFALGQGQSPGAGDVRAAAGGRPILRECLPRWFRSTSCNARIAGRERARSHRLHRGCAWPHRGLSEHARICAGPGRDVPLRRW